MKSAESIRVQLHELLGQLDGMQGTPEELEGPLLESVRKCVVAGHFRNAVRLRREDNRYVTIGGGADGTRRGVEVDVHPSCCLRALRKRPPVVVFHEMVLTTKTYIRTVLDVETSWVVELSNGFYRTTM